MNAVMRHAVRRTSMGLGVLALAVGAAACGDDGDQATPEQDPGVEEPADQEDDQEAGPSDGGGDRSDAGGEEAAGDDAAGDGTAEDGASDAGGEDGAAGGELTDQDRAAAEDRFMEFLDAVAAQDGETACSLMINPETGETGDEDPQCVQVFEEEVVPVIEGGALGDLDDSMIDSEAGDDGTVTILLDGAAFPLHMSQGEDGDWYVTPSA